jgi:NitT/TauT family transport system substrate-binding protein
MRRSAVNLRRRVVAIATAVAACCALVGVANAQAPRKNLGKLVVIDAGKGIQYVLPTLARKLGYFDEEGLQVEITVAGSGTDATAALTGGQADIIQTGLPHFIATNEQGLQLWAIAPAIEAYTLSVMVGREFLDKTGVKPDSPLPAKMKALASQKARLGISRAGASTDLFIRYLCLETGVDCDKDLELIPLGAIGPTIAAFDQRRIIGYVRSHPDVDIGAHKAKGVILISGPAGQVPSLHGYLYLAMGTSERQIKGRPEHLAAFLRAVGKALKFVHAYPDQARAIAYEYAGTGVDKSVFDTAWAQSLPSFPKDLIIDAPGVAVTFKVLEKLEGRAPKIDPKKVYRTDLATEAWNAIADFKPRPQ